MATFTFTVNKDIEEFIQHYEDENSLSRSAAMRELLRMAVKSGVKSKPNTMAETRLVRFAISEAEASSLYALAQEKTTVGREQKWLAGVLTRYIHTHYLKYGKKVCGHGSGKSKDYTSIASALFSRHVSGLKERNEQKAFIALLAQAVDNRKIVMAQASTGVGKSLGIILASLFASKSHYRTVIAVPTLQVLRQASDQYKSLNKIPDYAVLMGKSEFVLVSRIEFILNKDPEISDADKVWQWLDEGGKALESSPFEQPYLAETLTEIAPAFPVKEVLLPRTIDESILDDPGYLSYQSLFERAGEASIIFCTHAMLAVDINVRGYALKRDGEDKILFTKDVKQAQEREIAAKVKEHKGRDLTQQEEHSAKMVAYYKTLTATKSAIEGVIPGGFDCVFIDEAQEFEKVVANTASMDVSVYRLHQNASALLKKLKIKDSTFKRAYTGLSKGSVNNGRIVFGRNSHYYGFINKLIKSSKKVLSMCAKQGLKDSHYYELKSQTSELERINYESMKSFRQLTITWTPIRRYPRILVGPKDVKHELEVLWGSVVAGGVVSASLYLPAPHHHGYMAKVLNLPEKKLMVSNPIISKWLTTPVTLHLPQSQTNTDDKKWLQYPSHKLAQDKVETAMERWAQQSGTIIERIIKKATGGTLVLCTAYNSSVLLFEHLEDKYGDRLVLQSKEERFEQTVARYKRYYVEGRRPVFIALGRAWTGLDITDTRKGINAKEDHMISDLVITKIPFNLNQSSTHHQRVLKNFMVEAFESVLLFMQGLGRLVRKRGVPEKNIWILDPRIVSLNSKDKTTTKYHRAILTRYTKRKIIKRPKH